MPDEPGKTDKRKSVIVVKGSHVWADWFSRLAREARMPGPVLIDVALAEFAKARGFEPPPER